jgi:hypothetical protein
MKRIKWNGEELEALFGQYESGHTCIKLRTLNGSPYATATINDPDADLLENEVIIKNYSENEGILESLEEAGILAPLYLIAYGHANGVVCKLIK